MEKSQKIKTVSAVAIILVVVGLGYFLVNKYNIPREVNQIDKKQESKKVVVENMLPVNGAFSAPAGFPSDIPLEKEGIVESVTTSFPDQGAKQLSLSYQSSKTIAEKYSEYKTYMSKAGYTLSEGDAKAFVRIISGTTEKANLTVVISNADGKTLVQIAYLLKIMTE